MYVVIVRNMNWGIYEYSLYRGFDAEGEASMTEYVVTRWYRAPELLCEATHYGKVSDTSYL